MRVVKMNISDAINICISFLRREKNFRPNKYLEKYIFVFYIALYK